MAGFYKNILHLLFTTMLFASPWDDLSQNYFIRNWNAESGLKHNTVNALWQCKNGYIWIGTPAGLARFDGIRFTHYNHWNTSAIQNDHVTCLFEDLYGNLWIGTDGGGLIRYKNGNWEHFSSNNGLSDDYIRAICNDWQGNLWVATDNGLNRYDLDKWEILSTDDGLHDNIVTSLGLDPEGNLLIGTFRNGFAKYDQNIVRNYGYADGLANLSVYCLKSDASGNIWIGTREGLFFLDHKNDRIRYIAETAYTPVTDLLIDNDSEVWIASMVDGLKKIGIYDSELSFAASALADEYIRCLLKDRNGNLWVGTDNSGLNQIKKAAVSVITQDAGLPDNNISTVLKDRSGNLWVGGNTAGLFRIRNKNSIDVITTFDSSNAEQVNILFEDNAGNILAGTENGMLYRVNNNMLEKFESGSSFESGNINSIAQEDNNRLWFAADSGLFYYEKGQFNNKVLTNGDKSIPINTLYTSRSGKFYIVSGKNLFVYINDRSEKLLTAESDIRCLYEDPGGALWIGTRNTGLLRWYKKELSVLTVKNGLPHNNILSITEDRSGSLWLSCPLGIIQISRSTLADFYDHRQTFVITALFNETDGMVNSRCSSRGSPVVTYTAGRDTIFYATAGGITIIDINKILDSSSLPIPHIEEITAGQMIIPFINHKPVHSNSGNLRFRFTAFDYSAPGKIFFRYRLAGFDTAYIPLFPGQERVIDYNGLESGEYHLSLQAANRRGEWSKITDSILLHVKRPFYSTLYFYLITGSITMAVIISLIIAKSHRDKKRLSEKYRTVVIPEDTAESSLNRLQQLMEVEKIFLDPDLTLSILARRLHLNANQLSRIINERFGQNFNDYINNHRIREAQIKLSDPACRDKNILDILYETGFYSKSVFNTAFKKITGQTPSAYRRSQTS